MVAASQPYDDRDGWIWMDGKMVPWREAKIHVLTHALHYGSAVFEGERIYGGKVFKLREHSQRLIDSGKILGFDVPMTVEQIDAATNEVVAANKMKDGYVRPIAWRGAEQMGVAAQQTKIHVAIASWDWGAYFGTEAKMKGLKLCMAKYRRPDPATSPCLAKATGLYMICTLEKHAAEAAGYSDALMLDWRGQVAETTGANVFFVMDGEIHTPKADCFLDGITRRTVMGLARQRQYKVVERAIMPQEMGKATEAFLTGTAAEITPIASIGDYKFTPGTITKNLLADFEALTRA
ncbi:MAG TPA: branched-chain amino acid aminotransferase [Alphaproteobacteria bacterium]|nr:branched-chain amino acid aminotransferase [Alphaproteobacteria bacterium]